MSAPFEAYLILERVAADLDARYDSSADPIRRAMELLYTTFTAHEIDYLTNRGSRW